MPKLQHPSTLSVFSFLSFVFFFIAMAPSHLHPDGVSLLCQGRSGFFEDIHPPLISMIYGASDWIIKGPF